MYWREYRTEFHIGLTYGVSESTMYGFFNNGLSGLNGKIS